MTKRASVIGDLANLILAVARPHPVRVGLDGFSAAGKTTLANELTGAIEARGRIALRASLDDFKLPVARRGRYPSGSPEEYYYEMYDHQAIRTELLEPLGPDGSRRFRTATFDQRRQAPVSGTSGTAANDAIMLVDGAFLYRPELNDLWDFRIFVDIDFELVLDRGSHRDQAWMDTLVAAEDRYRKRYIPGEKIYLQAVRPHQHADVIVDNRDLNRPRLQALNAHERASGWASDPV